MDEQVNSMDFRTIEDLQLLIMDDNRLTYFADDALSHMDNLMEVRSLTTIYCPRSQVCIRRKEIEKIFEPSM